MNGSALEVRRSARQGLADATGALGTLAAVGFWVRALTGETVAHEATLGPIRAGLTSTNSRVRAESVEGLVALGDTKGLYAALRSRDVYVRTRAVQALGALPGDTIVWRLVPLAWDPAREVRFAVAEVLARRTCWLAVWVLRRLASDKDALLRYNALTALAYRDRGWAASRLRAVMSSDPEPWLRDAAERLLHRCEAAVSR